MSQPARAGTASTFVLLGARRPVRIEREARTASVVTRRVERIERAAHAVRAGPFQQEVERGIMDENPSGTSNPIPDATVKRLRDLRRSLLHLHKMLLDMERADYERAFGSVNSGELLQLVINHAQFAWLRLISALIVEIDEMLSAEEPATVNDAQNLFTQARLLFTSPADDAFREKYQAALQREPAVVMAHSEVANLLRTERQA